MERNIRELTAYTPVAILAEFTIVVPTHVNLPFSVIFTLIRILMQTYETFYFGTQIEVDVRMTTRYIIFASVLVKEMSYLCIQVFSEKTTLKYFS